MVPPITIIPKTYCEKEENYTYIEWLISAYNEAMNYFYIFFAYICFELSVAAKRAVSKEQSNNTIELFNNILKACKEFGYKVAVHS